MRSGKQCHDGFCPLKRNAGSKHFAHGSCALNVAENVFGSGILHVEWHVDLTIVEDRWHRLGSMTFSSFDCKERDNATVGISYMRGMPRQEALLLAKMGSRLDNPLRLMTRCCGVRLSRTIVNIK